VNGLLGGTAASAAEVAKRIRGILAKAGLKKLKPPQRTASLLLPHMVDELNKISA